MYMDKYKPEPPPKPLSRGALMALTAAAAVMAGPYSNSMGKIVTEEVEGKIRNGEGVKEDAGK